VDTFTYTASDEIGGSSVATVTVMVGLSGTDSAGVIITPVSLTLAIGGPPVRYTIALQTQPAADVTISVIADGLVTAVPPQLVFTPDNWEIPQSVTLQASLGVVLADIRQGTVRHTVQSADSAYNNLGVPNLIVNITSEGTIFLPMLGH
jgi:uncharacterized protein